MMEIENVMGVSHGFTAVTGFANQIWLWSRAMIEENYETELVHKDYKGEPIYFAEGSETATGRDVSGITMLPWGYTEWCKDKMPMHINEYEPDVVFSLGDIWCYQYLAEIKKHKDFFWLAHYVFDTENFVSEWHNSMKNANVVVVPSKNSYEMLQDRGYEKAFHIPHGIDTDIYQPCDKGEKQRFRREIEIPEDDFVILCVAHNQQRKKLDKLLEAFRIFGKEKKDVTLIFHSHPRDPAGWNLPLLADDYGIIDNIMFTNLAAKQQGDIHVGTKDLRKLYCSADVHALPTGGEGFGLPVVEAMACGIPNVMTDYTTAREFLTKDRENNPPEEFLNGYAGIAVPYQSIEHHHTGGIWAHINTHMMAKAFQHLYDNPHLKHKMGSGGRKRAEKYYNENTIKDKWKELFSDLPQIAEQKEKNETKLKALRVRRRNG